MDDPRALRTSHHPLHELELRRRCGRSVGFEIHAMRCRSNQQHMLEFPRGAADVLEASCSEQGRSTEVPYSGRSVRFVTHDENPLDAGAAVQGPHRHRIPLRSVAGAQQLWADAVECHVALPKVIRGRRGDIVTNSAPGSKPKTAAYSSDLLSRARPTWNFRVGNGARA